MFPPMANPNLEISAAEFERLVRDWIIKQSGELTSLEVKHDVKVEAYDSTYQIDVLAKFQAFAGAEFTVLIECKKYRNAVERELVQVLHDKVRSVGAHIHRPRSAARIAGILRSPPANAMIGRSANFGNGRLVTRSDQGISTGRSNCSAGVGVDRR